MSCKGFPPLSTFVPSVLPPIGPVLQTVATAIEKAQGPGLRLPRVTVPAKGVKAEAYEAVKRGTKTSGSENRPGRPLTLAIDRIGRSFRSNTAAKRWFVKHKIGRKLCPGLASGSIYQAPVLPMEIQGSAGGRFSPF